MKADARVEPLNFGQSRLGALNYMRTMVDGNREIPDLQSDQCLLQKQKIGRQGRPLSQVHRPRWLKNPLPQGLGSLLSRFQGPVAQSTEH